MALKTNSNKTFIQNVRVSFKIEGYPTTSEETPGAIPESPHRTIKSDTLISAIARTRRRSVATKNIGHFKKVKNLKLITV
jgi:predicted nucleic acid-binding protein